MTNNINTKIISEEPKTKDKMIFIRIPTPVAERLEHQRLRLSCPMNTLARMAIIRFLEIEEADERKRCDQRDDSAK
jgi:hypothetical protein